MSIPQVSFSGSVKDSIRRRCEIRLRRAYASMSVGSKVFCHIVDQELGYSGSLLLHLTDGLQLTARSIADDPVDVLDDMILNIEGQIRFHARTLAESDDNDSRIIIVDDDPDSVQLMQKILKNLRQTAVYVQNPFVAIDMMVREDYKMIIMDINMPEISGLQAIAYADAKLRSRPQFMKSRVNYFATYSGEAKCELPDSIFRQFKHMGHWRKQKGYGELTHLVAEALEKIK